MKQTNIDKCYPYYLTDESDSEVEREAAHESAVILRQVRIQAAEVKWLKHRVNMLIDMVNDRDSRIFFVKKMSKQV